MYLLFVNNKCFPFPLFLLLLLYYSITFCDVLIFGLSFSISLLMENEIIYPGTGK